MNKYINKLISKGNNIYLKPETSLYLFTCRRCGEKGINIEQLMEHKNMAVCLDCYEEIIVLEQDEELGKDLKNEQNEN